MVVSRLHLKLLRDIRFSPAMFAGIVFLLLVGIALYGASYELFLNLQNSYALSYQRLHLADFTVPVQSAPTHILPTLRRIPGVGRVEGRIVQEVEIEQPAADTRKVIGRIISLPDAGDPQVNQLKLIAGDMPGRSPRKELLLEASFARYHHYRPGDTLTIVILEDEVRFRVAGIVQSPEYIFVVRGREYPMPTPSTFGVMWMRKSEADALFDSGGAVNDVSVTMAPGGNRQTAARLAEQLLRPYGATEVITQEAQPSVELLRLDLQGLQTMAIFFPLLFLIISSLSVYNMLSRMVVAQRGQIGFLRAVGLSQRAVALHYVEFALTIGVLGGLLGSLCGHLLGILVTRFYTQYIEVPYYDVSPRWGVIIAGFLLAVGVSVVSGLIPARGAARITPAEALRAEAPAQGRVPPFERYLRFLRGWTLLSRLPLRYFVRNPRRTLATIAGVASAATLLLISLGLNDSTEALINFYFDRSIRYDIMASYLTPRQQFALQQFRRWPGVTRVEPVLALPAELRRGAVTETIFVYGIPPDTRLTGITTATGELVPLAPDGLMISEGTARKLGVVDGALVRLTLPSHVQPDVERLPAISVLPGLGGLPTPAPPYRTLLFAQSTALLEHRVDRMVRVSGVTYQPAGAVAYAPIELVRAWYGKALELPPNAINAFTMQVEARNAAAVERRLYEVDGIASLDVVRSMREEIDELLQQSRTFFTVMIMFSVALAGVIIFNATLMNVIERTREIATLRTLGISVGAVARMIWVENLLAYLLGLIVGTPLGILLHRLFVASQASESFTLTPVIFPRTYLIAALGILATVALAQLPSLRYIRKIALAKATKDVG